MHFSYVLLFDRQILIFFFFCCFVSGLLVSECIFFTQVFSGQIVLSSRKRDVKTVGCQKYTMLHDEWTKGDVDQGRIWEKHKREWDRRARQKWQEKKGQKKIKCRIFFLFYVIFKQSSSHGNSRGWVTEWLFYYVADWPQPSNIWTCMCVGFLLLIISVLLVASFSHSSVCGFKKIMHLKKKRCFFFFTLSKTCLCWRRQKVAQMYTKSLIACDFHFATINIFVTFRLLLWLFSLLYVFSWGVSVLCGWLLVDVNYKIQLFNSNNLQNTLRLNYQVFFRVTRRDQQ